MVGGRQRVLGAGRRRYEGRGCTLMFPSFHLSFFVALHHRVLSSPCLAWFWSILRCTSSSLGRVDLESEQRTISRLQFGVVSS